MSNRLVAEEALHARTVEVVDPITGVPCARLLAPLPAPVTLHLRVADHASAPTLDHEFRIRSTQASAASERARAGDGRQPIQRLQPIWASVNGHATTLIKVVGH